MKNKILFLLLWGIFQAVPAVAGWNIQSNKTYYLRCDYAQGFIGLSSEQGLTTGYVLYQQTYGDTPTADAYWQIIPSGGGYAFRNVYSGQYLSWSDDYSNLRNLDLVDELSGDDQLWELVATEKGVNIKSLSHPDKCFHMRNTNNAYQVALYSNANDPKSVFHIYDSNGVEIVEDSELRYHIQNANGFGYMVYDPAASETYLSLQGCSTDLTAEHAPSNYLYIQAVDFSSENTQWSISYDENGDCYLYNIGRKAYISCIDYKYQFVDDPQPITRYDKGDGTFAFRLATSGGTLDYMCAAPQNDIALGEKTPISCWSINDAGSAWIISEVTELNPETPIKVESISLQASSTEVQPYDVLQINATVLPENAQNPSLTWTSDNPNFSVTQDGLVTVSDYGTATITATAQDGSGVSGSITLNAVNLYMAYGEEMLYLRHRDSTVTVLPLDLVETYNYRGSLFTATLVNQESIQWTGIVDTCSSAPTDVPGFYTYKFNNKYNPQVFTDVESSSPQAEQINLSVAGIGKWLTASFKLADPATRVYVESVRQKSKYTRQSFARPVTYRFTNPKWNILRLRLQDDGLTYAQETSPYERRQTVNVTFLTDHSTNEYTVPRIDITLTDYPETWDETIWIGMNGKRTYENATISIQGGGVFPDMPSTPMYIKGRGNSSWSSDWSSKNPYHFKFDSKQKPLGMTAGKHWILLANKQSGSMTSNAMGMKAANIFETAGNNHIVPVELYINGSYRGSYNLTERVGFSNNSIDLLDESCAAMMELDTYGDETIYNSNAYGVSTKIHIPDADDIAEGKTSLSYDQILADYDNMMNVLYQGGDAYTKLIDAEYLARYLSACELIWNYELQHPKSVFLYSENVTDGFSIDGSDATPWIFGPLWDCDWAFGYEGSGEYFGVSKIEMDLYDALQSRCKGFWYDLRHNSQEVDSIYYRLWYELKQRNVVQELYDYAQEYYDFAKKSFEHNRQNETSNRDGRDYVSITQNAQNWMTRRFNYIFNSLTPYDLPAESDDPTLPGPDVMGDVNDDGVISTADVVTLLNELIGLPTESYYQARADIDSNGEISIGDVVMLCNMVMEQNFSARRHLHLPAATMHLYATATTLPCFDEGTAYLIAEVDEGGYSALQMDISLPQGVEPLGVELPEALEGMSTRIQMLDNGNYRLLLYADGSITLPTAPVKIGLRLSSGAALEGRLNISAPVAITELGEEERLTANSAKLIVLDVTGVQEIQEAEDKEPVIYDLSGRPVKNPAKGVYIRNNKKYIR